MVTKRKLETEEEFRLRRNQWARDNQNKRTIYMKEYREKNRDKMNKQANLSHKKHRFKHKDKIRDYHLRRFYGLSLTQFNTMLENQKGCCLICNTNNPKGQGSFHVDHCHTTGKIRGLLCSNCNTKLGWFEKYSKEIISYLEVFGPPDTVW